MLTPSVDNLLESWERAQADGRPLTPEELCRECPDRRAELKRHLAALAQIAAIMDTAAPRPDRGAGLHSLEPARPAANPASARIAPDRYQVIRPHAEGALGEVLLAEDRILGRPVALKPVRASRADDLILRQRFLREAAITGQLQHPGVVPIYDLICDEADRKSTRLNSSHANISYAVF